MEVVWEEVPCDELAYKAMNLVGRFPRNPWSKGQLLYFSEYGQHVVKPS